MAKKKKPTSGETPAPRWQVTRRDFLRYTGIATAVVATPTFLAACGKDGEFIGATETALDVSNLSIDWSLDVKRREDLLVLNFGFVNLQKVGSPPKLQRTHAGPALIVLTLPPQHVLEQCVPEGTTPPATALQTTIARESRLVFVIPDATPAVDFTTANLLALLKQAGLNVNSNATGGAIDPSAPGTVSGGAAGAPRAPAALETAIEMPYRVLLSPNQYARFNHATAPVNVRERYELWHTRLGTSVTGGTPADEKTPDRRTARALWTRDDDAGTAAPAVTLPPLTPQNRRDIVGATGNFAAGATPQAAIQVKQLALSALGGWMDTQLDVPPTNSSGLERWINRSAMGRDTHVEVIYRGFVFPFGHRMSLLTISDRRFDKGQGSGTPAALYQAKILIVREPERQYPELGNDQDPTAVAAARQMPFRSLRFLNLRSPPLDQGTTSDGGPFVPMVGGQVFRWECEAIDRRGRKVKLAPTIVWCPENPRYLTNMSIMNGLYQGSGQPRIATNSQRFALASAKTGEDTTFESTSISFQGARIPVPVTVPMTAPFAPTMSSTEIAVDAIRAVTGAGDVKSFVYSSLYTASGFDATDGKNPREIFLELAASVPPIVANFAKQADKSGGFVAPSLEIKGLSRLTGPVSDIANTAQVAGASVFNANLAGMMPKLFGCVSLADVIGDSSGKGGLAQMTPRFVAEALTDAERLLATGQRLLDNLLTLKDDLPNAILGLQATVEQNIKTHANAILAEVQADKLLVENTVNGLSTLVQNMGGNVPIDTLVQQVNLALPTNLLTQLKKLRDLLTNPLTSKLGALMAGLDVVFRTAERFLRGIAEIVGEAQNAVDLLRAGFVSFLRGLELVRDGTVHLEWKPLIHAIGPFKPQPDSLVLSADIRTKQRGSENAGVDLICSLENFDLDLEVVDIGFQKLQFRQKSGKKPEIDVILKNLDFTGILEFVETLKNIIPMDGFSDPPNIEVSPSGLKAGFTLALPSVAVGVFSLEHMSISAALEVPFLGDAITFRFAFCSRENPFIVTVCMLGGGGFFAVTLSPKGVTALEASIEFGARLSINLGVASGSVEIMGGIYFSWHDGQGAMLQGYLRIRGEVDVLGLISASIELRMSLEYYFTEKKVIGRASLEIEISICFFSTSVTIETERRFAGANGDPTFIELVGPLPPQLAAPHPWLDYWETFAQAAA